MENMNDMQNNINNCKEMLDEFSDHSSLIKKLYLDNKRLKNNFIVFISLMELELQNLKEERINILMEQSEVYTMESYMYEPTTQLELMKILKKFGKSHITQVDLARKLQMDMSQFKSLLPYLIKKEYIIKSGSILKAGNPAVLSDEFQRINLEIQNSNTDGVSTTQSDSQVDDQYDDQPTTTTKKKRKRKTKKKDTMDDIIQEVLKY